MLEDIDLSLIHIQMCIRDSDDTNYKVIYTYDLNTLSDKDINNLGINRDLNTFKTTLTNRGLTCK